MRGKLKEDERKGRKRKKGKDGGGREEMLEEDERKGWRRMRGKRGEGSDYKLCGGLWYPC
jgi:hypothetical protein